MTLSLAEAQALLAQRRAELGIKQPVSPVPNGSEGVKRVVTETAVSSIKSPTELPKGMLVTPQAGLPAHLGWHSATLSQHLRARQTTPTTQPTPITPLSEEMSIEREQEFVAEVGNQRITPLTSTSSASEYKIPTPPHIRLHPSLAMAWLKAGLVAPARVWLLLRHLDQAGRGWLALTAVRQHLTNPDSPFCLCGKRQLRNLLKAGDGLFWARDGQRIWLRGMKKMCGGLTAVSQLRQICGQAVSVPLLALKNIKTAKAHFYASFHSSRNDHRKTNKQSKPIARDTLTDLFGLSGTSQRRYEAITGIHKQVNYAVGSVATPESIKTTAYQRGYAAFVLTDVLGKHGKPNQRYNAWQLPNSYSGPHQSASNGRKKNINSYLNDLSQTGMTGNEGIEDDEAVKAYYDGKSAAKLYNKGHLTELYWSEAHSPYWYHLPAK